MRATPPRVASLLALGAILAWALVRDWRVKPAARVVIAPKSASLLYETFSQLYYLPPDQEAFYPPSPSPPPPPPPGLAAARPSWRPDASAAAPAAIALSVSKLSCAGLLLPEAQRCSEWYASRDGSARTVSTLRGGGFAKACAANCHGHGICDAQTGFCACEAGYNGSACEGINLRECNGATDGLWHASHCAGECDERRGLCWCPGRIGERPLGDTCQVKHMPLEAFAALTLKPDPAWIRFAANESKIEGGLHSLPRREQSRRRDAYGLDLQSRTDALRADPARRASVVERFWFGSYHDDASGGSLELRGGGSRWSVTVSEHGIPHATRSQPASKSLLRPHLPSTLPPRRDRRSSVMREAEEAALPAAPMLPEGDPEPARDGALYQKLAARPTSPHDSILGAPSSWCEARPGKSSPAMVAHRCPCLYDGMHGELCEKRHEAFCLNQCSGHGRCDINGGFCHCDANYFGIDCSMTHASDGRVTLHENHAAVRSPRSPSIFVYELWDHTSLILQYRAYRGYCVHRYFTTDNRTEFNDAYAYSVETAMHEQMLSSAHRTLDGETADFFYVPSYLSCTILPVYDWVGPGPFALGYPMRPVTAMRMSLDALEQIRSRFPYFDRSISRGSPNHLFLFSHDEGACWAPKELYDHSIILTHWGRMDETPHSSSRYIPDNWERTWTLDERAPAGQRWTFPRRGGSRGLIGVHPCYSPSKDIVVPVFAPPVKWGQSPWVSAGAGRRAVRTPRTTLAYFSGNLAINEPLKYARGIRHRLRNTFQATAGWRLVGKAGATYSRDLANSEFCIVPPGGDGWSSRVDDAVRHGCIPVIVMDNVQMPFESLLNYSAFALRVPESDVERLDEILRSVDTRTRRRMRAEMRRIWVRFTYARSFLDADAYLPPRLPRDHLREPALVALRAVAERGAPDAFDTLMLALHDRAKTDVRGGGPEARAGPRRHVRRRHLVS